MKKLLGIVVLGLLLSFTFTSPSFAKWCVNPNYENLTDEELLGGAIIGGEFSKCTNTTTKRVSKRKFEKIWNDYRKKMEKLTKSQKGKTKKHKIYTAYAKHTKGTKVYQGSSTSLDIAEDAAILKCKNQDPYAKNDPEGCRWVNSEIAEKPEEKKPIKKEPVDEDDIIIIGSGSGFFVSDQGHVVSNDHVVGVCKKVKAYEDGEEVLLKILATDMVNDIGLVKGKFKNKKYLNIKTDGAELGEDIVTFGYPLSQTLSDSVKLTKGIVSSLTGLGNNISQIQIDAAIQPGNSGGPVLNMNGQVVGIASAGLSKLYMAKEANYIPENVNFAVASQTLTAFLKAHKISIGTSANRTLNAKELAKIGEPTTIQLFCMNTMAEYARLKEADKHSDVLLDLQ